MISIFGGEYERALALSAEAREAGRAIGNLWNEAYSYYMVDLVHFDRGEIETAIETAEAGRRLSEQAGFVEGLNQGSFNLVLILDYMGDQKRALEIARETQARADALAGEAHAWRALESVVAQLHLHAGRPVEAQAVLDRASIGPNLAGTRPQFTTEYLFMGAVTAEMALAQGDVEQALDLAEDVIGILRESGTRLFLTDALLLQGQALLAAGRRAEAEAALGMAQAEAEALGSRRTLWQVLAERARLADADGAQAEAAALWRQAGEIVAYIAVHAGSEALADSFRARAEVREIIEAR
jgi:tetratricopeptide (TPR) repeat protein